MCSLRKMEEMGVKLRKKKQTTVLTTAYLYQNIPLLYLIVWTTQNFLLDVYFCFSILSSINSPVAKLSGSRTFEELFMCTGLINDPERESIIHSLQ